MVNLHCLAILPLKSVVGASEFRGLGNPPAAATCLDQFPDAVLDVVLAQAETFQRLVLLECLRTEAAKDALSCPMLWTGTCEASESLIRP